MAEIHVPETLEMALQVGALVGRTVRVRESEGAARADRFKEEAVSSDTPVGEIFRPQQAVRTK